MFGRRDAAPREADVVVVGAGLAGLAAARALSPRVAPWSSSRLATGSAGGP